ncbi:MAG: hypothetical protein IK104_06310, partial [Clostridia bacterium]|nr:hypothetical protein [Clostridia bacterium]
SFVASYLSSEQSERQGIILADIPCRAGSSGGKERRKTCIIPYLHRPKGAGPSKKTDILGRIWAFSLAFFVFGVI